LCEFIKTFVSFQPSTDNYEYLAFILKVEIGLWIRLNIIFFILIGIQMRLDRYELKAEDSLMVFEFVSEGKRGEIVKIIKYSETNLKGVFNLAFGDKEVNKNTLDDFSISDNGDRDKILATVVSTLYAFTDKYPNSLIYATGSTKARTRLYRMGIAKFIDEIEQDFHVYGLHENEWEDFDKNIEYDAFLTKRKNSIFTV
jgi:hypothetical protein